MVANLLFFKETAREEGWCAGSGGCPSSLFTLQGVCVCNGQTAHDHVNSPIPKWTKDRTNNLKEYARGDEKMGMYAQYSEFLGTPDQTHREMPHLNCQRNTDSKDGFADKGAGGIRPTKLSWIDYLNIDYITIWGTSVAVSCQI